MTPEHFDLAVPVWIKGRENEENVSLCLTANVGPGSVTLKISACSVYQLFVNGEIAAEGPARTAHGFYRVDELDLSPFCVKHENAVTILVAGYNVPNYYLIQAPAFVCAELYENGKPVAVTGQAGFDARLYTERVQKVRKFSFQRTLTEAYVLPGGYEPVELAPVGPKAFITREVPYPRSDRADFQRIAAQGTFTTDDPESEPDNGLTVDNEREAKRIRNVDAKETDRDPSVITLGEHEYAILDLGRELTGFFTFDIETTGGRLIVTFDELMRDGDVPFDRLTVCGSVIYDLAPGRYRLVSFEPYSLRFLKFSSLADRVTITAPGLVRFEFGGDVFPAPDFKGDETLARIYEAAVSTFRQNTLDIYMDCPSRERAGWLCDSFFTSRTERALTGKSVVEHAFLDNFLMSENPDLPHGMLPMCYPSDHRNQTYIPNWAMWYGIELSEYRDRTGDETLIADAKKAMYDLIAFFRRFENQNGVLEKLESWVFVEWSHSNDLVQDINYPSNMLYAKFKRSIGELYGDGALIAEADALAETIRRESLRNGWFCDNAVFDETGVAHLTGEVTETCQYYAFFSGVATKERDPALWNALLNEFGPERKTNNTHPDIAFSNAFIGNYLRLELLFREGLTDKLLKEIKGYFDYMAKKTGTLWENDGDYASCNHGFASYVAVWLRDIFA